jgi:hypothetical protein
MESSFLAPPFNNIHVSLLAWNEIKVIMGMLLFGLLCKKFVWLLVFGWHGMIITCYKLV